MRPWTLIIHDDAHVSKETEWYESRSALLDRFCALDTADWNETDFFHFLQKPWQSQYEISHDHDKNPHS
jgi:hypothetical protein